MILLVKYREAFSCRDEIGNCLKIEVGLQVIGIVPFFIRSFQIKEDKPMTNREMQ